MMNPEAAQQFSRYFRTIVDNVGAHLQGKRDVVEQALICLLAQGHLLLEDVPGVGKTSLARALALSLGAQWQRIQFTPDLLPSDVTGGSVYDQSKQTFEFHHGPVFANIVLADEINRASPKTQSALLEVMEEGTVTADGVPHAVPTPFMVVATQNPIDMDGTYPLPEAQVDRFLMRLSMGYPDLAAETQVLANDHQDRRVEDLTKVLDLRLLAALIEQARYVYVHEPMLDYIARLSRSTRDMPAIRLGASPRGSLGLLRAARVRAASQGRNYVSPDDVQALATAVLAHRLLLAPEAELAYSGPEMLVRQAIDATPVPQ
jgi:MoxR-like ATPase